MTNRSCFIPIFLTATLSFAASSLLSRAEPGVPNEPTSTPAPAATAPAPAVKPAAPTPTVTGSTLTQAVTTPATPTASPTTYTVVAGDSFSLVAKKFGCTVPALKRANGIAKSKSILKPGQVLKIPTPKGKPATPAAAPKPSASATSHKTPASPKTYAHAQPVQDFDVPASTFASCPVPDPANAPETPAPSHVKTPPEADTAPTSAPVAQLVSPDELDADAAAQPKKVVAPKPAPAPVVAAAKPAPLPVAKPLPDVPPSTPTYFPSPSSSSKQTNRNSFFASSTSAPLMGNDWANRFLQQARDLSNKGIEYDESWRPPGEAHAWAMDCSNTARYLYKVTTGLQLPRTASDQYYYLHLQNKAWDVPQASNGFADTSYLKEKLKPGDLLFWENTYRPERQPPITHVMVFLGNNEKGEWIMAGSQSSRGGLHNRRGGGPDIYVFDPCKPSGGYTTWLGLVRHKGRFCAFGRPLEADPAKLSVAAN